MTAAGKSLFKPTPNIRAIRRRTLVKVQLYDSKNELQDVMVENVSSSGIRATARKAPPNLNEVVTVQLSEGIVLWGLVRWVEGRLFGVEFDVSSSQIDLADANKVSVDGPQIDYKG